MSEIVELQQGCARCVEQFHCLLDLMLNQGGQDSDGCTAWNDEKTRFTIWTNDLSSLIAKMDSDHVQNAVRSDFLPSIANLEADLEEGEFVATGRI